ncbi:MAG TPA: hypothetical protein DD723_09855 [Candidatus Omnitrophica bacterium]|nr:MAG: hypothetical protein A2Z81_06265 [Omnitrophica WOR_2 bacterium GWA2_45_18]HBR15823.1 hypothetical protein [Candidatus Omnitrophota bacterium]
MLKNFLSKETWVFLLLSALTLVVLVKFVDLTPHVDSDFFFSNDDLHYQADNEISRLFTRKDTQLIISARGDIFSEDYKKRIEQLSNLILTLDAVTSLKSITHGPNGIHDALASPFWKRLLISTTQESTNIIVILDANSSQRLISKIEDMIYALQSDHFHIKISGFPYIVDLINRYLIRDFRLFSALAFTFFGIVILIIFHSWRILLGVILSCANSCNLTFLMTHLLDVKIGILTANLATIIFVMTLSHIVFMTFNWENLKKTTSGKDPEKKEDHETKDPHALVQEALKITFWASFWSMFTTFLGFLSLLSVQAKPLRELGTAGSIGTLMAFFIAYGIYPSFLRLEKSPHHKLNRHIKHYYQRSYAFLIKRKSLVMGIIFGIILMTFHSLGSLNTDPSLISYFSEKSKITEGLKYIDRNGGSSPLIIVIKDAGGERLNTNQIYHRLWALQKDLEKNPDIGTVVSLPVLLAEGKRSKFSFFVGPEKMLDILESPAYDRIAESFVTKDRRYGLFLLRMNELNRTATRLEVIEGIQKIIRAHHFTPHLVGGIYALQGHLASLVATSLIYGLLNLTFIFFLIALIHSHSLRIAVGMTLSICLLPFCMVGAVGFLKVPLDIISAPAANLAMSMGIDAMLHLTQAYQRFYKSGQGRLKAWLRASQVMYEPVITSTFIVCSGFGIFFCSSFPPTQRFGGAIVFGMLVSAFTAIFIFPALSRK